MNQLNRFNQAYNKGFKYIVYDDNYPHDHGSHLSFNCLYNEKLNVNLKYGDPKSYSDKINNYVEFPNVILSEKHEREVKRYRFLTFIETKG